MGTKILFDLGVASSRMLRNSSIALGSPCVITGHPYIYIWSDQAISWTNPTTPVRLQ